MNDKSISLFPLWLKVSYTILVTAVVVIYWFGYGPLNFLWFSDIALILMVPALWFESSLITSMMVIGVLPYEIYWLADFITGGHLGGITAYMFGNEIALYLRLVSLFHLILPPLLIYTISKLGYNKRALMAQTILSFIVLPLCYFFTDPKENTNWVFGPGFIQHTIPGWVYLLCFMIVLPLFGYLPMHFLMIRIKKNKSKAFQKI